MLRWLINRLREYFTLPEKEEIRFYPCTMDKSGRIRNIVGPAMSRESAEEFLKTAYPEDWLRAQAIPQPTSHPYFKERAA